MLYTTDIIINVPQIKNNIEILVLIKTVVEDMYLMCVCVVVPIYTYLLHT